MKTIDEFKLMVIINIDIEIALIYDYVDKICERNHTCSHSFW